MILPTGFPPIASSLLPTHVSPRRKRINRIMTSCVLIQTVSPATQTPSPGAVCPAIVIYGARIINGDFNRMMPATLNTIVLAPPCSHAQRKLPGPSSFKLVTTITLPPRPPKLNLPPPSAPGNAGISACGKSVGRLAKSIKGFPFFASS